VDGQVRLPATAAERGGIQPVVSVTANGGALATVAVGEPVTLSVHAEAPAAGGTIVSVQWDFDSKGTYPYSDPSVDGSATSVTLTTTHTYSEPGTYFATALVASHVDGDVSTPHRRLQNLASARVVVN
jgi:PKD domain-containing protein